METLLLPTADNYEDAKARFTWEIPEKYNMGEDVCDRWAQKEPDRVALIHEREGHAPQQFTFGWLRAKSNQAANCFRRMGGRVGDRIAILLPQTPETAICHIAIYKMGAIAVPLFTLFGQEALEFRLQNSGARFLVTDLDGASKIAEIRDHLPELKAILIVGDSPDSVDAEERFEAALARESEEFSPVETKANDPALIIYTSGTTGKPKGALHAHRVLLGHMPGVEMSHGGTIDADSIFWTPADWAWIGGLLDVLMPALRNGVPVVAGRLAKFNATAAYELMSRHAVTNVFLPPTALKILRSGTDLTPRKRWPLKVRSIASGGESLGEEMLAWAQDALGVSINEFYGQTECNMVVSSCNSWFAPQAGSMGKSVLGHDVRIVNESGEVLPAGQVGLIGIRAPDPVMFLGYWGNEAATRERYAGAFLLTGDQGCMDDSGFLRFIGRDDDVITSAGYRIGPGPIEDCLLGHAAVSMAAVIGVPDVQRTEVVKAFIVLSDGNVPSEALTQELQAHVRVRLAAHEYPRLVEYVDHLPMTATGKIIRKALRSS